MTKFTISRRIAFYLALVFAVSSLLLETAPAAPLKVHPSNPRYVSDDSGRAIYLTGSHERNNFQVSVREPELSEFDYDGYLQLLAENGHNFIRLWAWEDARWDPLPFARSDSGTANDGGPKFDLTKFNPEYFDELRARVVAARDRGLHVGVMLFQGWSVGNNSYKPGYVAWDFHPFHRENNVNGVNGDLDNDGEGKEVHTLRSPRITELQKAYVRKVIDALNDLDNVIWEIANESPADSTSWQYEMIRFIKSYEATKPKQHLVWMTSQFQPPTNRILFESPADVISPHAYEGIGMEYRDDPPAADGTKVIVNDTDHLTIRRAEREMVWKSFMRGLNPIVIDARINGLALPGDEHARAAMGHTAAFAARMNLARAVPRPKLSSTRYALADPGSEYLVYQPRSGSFSVELPRGVYGYEWFNPATGRVVARGNIEVEQGARRFSPPFDGPAVLYLVLNKTEVLAP